MMLLAITAPVPAVFTSIPVAAPVVMGFFSEKPSTVTLAELIAMTGLPAKGFAPVTVDSRGPPDPRPATGIPAWAALSVRVLGIDTFSAYAPGATSIVEQPGSLTAARSEERRVGKE